MKNMNRRDLCLTLTALAALPGTLVEGQMPAGTTLSKSQSFPFDQMHGTPNQDGFISRQVVRGVLATGETVEMHESTLQPGKMPHPPHRHRHSEFLMIREGQIDFYNDGVTEHVGPGGVIFISSNVKHGMKNVGDAPANYFVVGVGPETPAVPA